jgi:hypothetical protein
MTTKYYIYSISHSTDPSLGKYIGSTKDLPRRKALHKFDCKTNTTLKLYQVMRDNGGWDAWVIKTLEIVYSDNPEDRRKCEQKWMDAQEVKLNTNQAYCPQKMYYDKHRDGLLNGMKDYYLRNREAITAKKREQQKQKRQEYIAQLRAQGLEPKRRSKNDPEPALQPEPEPVTN